MNEIGRLAAQFQQVLMQRHYEITNLDTKESLCWDYTNYDPDFQKFWISSILFHQEAQRFGPLILPSNQLLLAVFKLSIENIQNLGSFEDSVQFHRSIDSILTKELNDCLTIDDLQRLLDTLSSYSHSNQIDYKYFPLAIQKISTITLNFLMNPSKTVESLQNFVMSYLNLRFIQYLNELTWTVIFIVCEFIETEIFNKRYYQIASKCQLLLFALDDVCINQYQKTHVKSLIDKIKPIIQRILPGNDDRDPLNDIRASLDLKLVSNRVRMFVNQISNFSRIQIEKARFNNQTITLKIYEIHSKRQQDLEKIYLEVRTYKKLSDLNKTHFLKFYGSSINTDKTQNPEESKTTVILALEYCEKSFANIIERNIINQINFTVEDILKYAYQLISGLKAMRDSGIIHMDIKPDSILIGSDGYVKIIDFQYSYFKVSGVTFTGVQVNLPVGTRGYSSPEKLEVILNQGIGASQSTYDPEKSDIFSLGLILYQIITLTAPIMYQHVSELQNDINKSVHINDWIKYLVNTMLMNNPLERFNYERAFDAIDWIVKNQ